MFQPRSSSWIRPALQQRIQPRLHRQRQGKGLLWRVQAACGPFRRGLQRLSGKPAAQHAEPQLQRDSTHDSRSAADSPDCDRQKTTCSTICLSSQCS